MRGKRYLLDWLSINQEILVASQGGDVKK